MICPDLSMSSGDRPGGKNPEFSRILSKGSHETLGFALQGTAFQELLRTEKRNTLVTTVITEGSQKKAKTCAI